SDPNHRTLNSCFGAFLSVSVDLDPFRYCMKLRAKRAKLLQLMQKFVPRRLVRNFCHDVILEIFATNAPSPHYWNLNSCFGAFLSIWVHLEPFRYCTKLAAKRAKLVQLMQKFVQRCLVIIFRNERSQSAPLDPKLKFWFVSFRLGLFWTVSLLHKTWCKTSKTGAINVKVHATMSC